MTLLKILRPTLPILIGAAIMLTLSGGIRQSFGLIMPPLTHDIAIWVSRVRARDVGAEPGLGLPAAGRGRAGGPRRLPPGDARRRAPLPRGHAHRHGRRPAGRHARGRRADRRGARLHRGGDRDVGGSRAVPKRSRSTVLGVITAAGSLGALLSAPMGQLLAVGFGWRAGVRASWCWRSHAAGGLVCRPHRRAFRCRSAADDIGEPRPGRQ